MQKSYGMLAASKVYMDMYASYNPFYTCKSIPYYGVE